MRCPWQDDGTASGDRSVPLGDIPPWASIPLPDVHPREVSTRPEGDMLVLSEWCGVRHVGRLPPPGGGLPNGGPSNKEKRARCAHGSRMGMKTQ